MELSFYKSFVNRSSRACPLVSSSENLVRNYHCNSSKYIRRQEWFIRFWLEHLCFPEMKTYLLTLTYRDRCHPAFSLDTMNFCRGKVNPNKLDFDKNRLPVFCKRDVQLFFKKLRKRSGLTIKYLVCSEYGKNFTKRGHYHIILNVYDTHNFVFLRDCVAKSWSYSGYIVIKGKKVRASLPLGRVDFACSPIDKTSYELKCANGYKYASKYVTKDDYLQEDERFKKLSDDDKYRLKDYMPFRTSSTNIGASWMEKLPVEDYMLYGVPYELYDLSTGTYMSRRAPLPFYCIDKLFYNHKYEHFSKVDNLLRYSDFVSEFMQPVMDVQGVKTFVEHVASKCSDFPYSWKHLDNEYLICSDDLYQKLLKENDIIVHTRSIRPEMKQKYFDFLKNSIDITAVNDFAKYDISSYDSRLLNYWMKIRGRFVLESKLPSKLSFLLEGEYPTYTKLYWAFEFLFNQEPYDKPYHFQYSSWESEYSCMGYRPLFSFPTGQYLDTLLAKYLEMKSTMQEKLCIESFQRELDIVATRQSYNKRF